jgi:hypothetical protein
MDWIDQNLDAYRVIAEILTDLRPLVRERIETKYGKEWFRDGIPEKVFERLILNKEQEASIDWYENRYQEVIGYAVFPDLFEIIIANPTLFGPILRLAPSQSLLNTRFLELEVMRSKIGRAREVGETEINFLTSFHLRFRRAVQELRGNPEEGSAPYEVTVPEPGSKPVPREAAPAKTDTSKSADKAPEIGVDDEKAKVADRPPEKSRPPQRFASPSVKEADAREEPEPVEVEVDAADEPEGEAKNKGEGAESKTRETTSTIIQRAMKGNDDQTVLREVYREVTGIAEVIWTTEEVPTTAVWDRVSTNPWYEAAFSRLELRPLSDFYDLISQVRAQRKAGVKKAEIQRFLNASNFATTLLALRDMFQRNHI